MNKNEAAAYLEIGLRSLERYTSDGRIIAGRVKGKTGPVLDYTLEEVERFKAELEAPPESPSPPPESPSTATSAAASSATSAATALARLPHRGQAAIVSMTAQPMSARLVVPVEHKLLLNLAEAQALTGLSRATLKAAIDEGELKGRRIGRAFRVSRAALEEWVERL